jgi:H+/Cl- antiporter ClcA
MYCLGFLFFFMPMLHLIVSALLIIAFTITVRSSIFLAHFAYFNSTLRYRSVENDASDTVYIIIVTLLCFFVLGSFTVAAKKF